MRVMMAINGAIMRPNSSLIASIALAIVVSAYLIGDVEGAGAVAEGVNATTTVS